MTQSTPKTLPALLKRNAAQYGDTKIALREKEFGIWQSVSWREYYDKIRHLSLGLVALGYEKGDKLSVIGDNRPEWLYSELAIQALGGAVVGIFPDSHLEQVQYIIDHSDSVFVMVEDQEQTDKILNMIDQVHQVKKVIVDDLKGMRHYDHPVLIPLQKVLAMGQEKDRQDPTLFETWLNQVQEDDVAMILYTSGTTGLPKGVMLTHRNLIRMIENFDRVDPAFSSDNHVSFLPLPWVGEQATSVAWNLYKGVTINFPEKVETVSQDIRDIGPHLLLAPPRHWEKMCSDIQVRIQDAAWIKRWIYNGCMPAGYHLADLKLQNKKTPFHWRVLNRICHLLLFRSLKNYLGLTNLRNVYTGGAPIGPEVFNFFMALGINIKQLYGQTEVTGIAVGHRNDSVKLNTVGHPMPGVELKISDAGEILIKGPTVFKGYYKNEEATRQTIDAEGWVHTGDEGILDDDGQLVMIDRQKDVMRLADGSKFSPQLIENKLKFSPYINEAMVVGKDRPHIAALIIMDRGNMGKWAENHKLTFTTFTDLSQKPEVYDLIASEIQRINRSLPRIARVRRFVMMYKELDADDDEMTRTRKLRRGFVAERYANLIEALYGAQEELPVESEIRYQDGTGFRMKTLVRIKEVIDEG
ncbi:MAG: AMP-binding protein [Deltaproteobacteria bacterium]|nr:AMP-binding protein [Deltaproteobacteria bacterium]